MEKWCANCKRDALWNGTKTMEDYEDDDLCQIIADSFDSEGAKEWVYDEDERPICTAFTPMDAPEERDDKTIDMFWGVNDSERITALMSQDKA